MTGAVPKRVEKENLFKSGLAFVGLELALMPPCVADAGFQFCHFPSVSHISGRLIIGWNKRAELIEEEESVDVGSPVTAPLGHMVSSRSSTGEV